jgi:hypothetical protein
MKNVYEFIDEGLEEFWKNNQICANKFSRLKQICLDLNKLLNKDCPDIEDDTVIEDDIGVLFAEMSRYLYIDATPLFKELLNWGKIYEINEERDHYYHSVQCFLLALALYPHFYKCQNKYDGEIIIPVLFSLAIYHDLGYFYKIEKPDIFEKNLEGYFTKLDENRLKSDLGRLQKILRLKNTNNIETIIKSSKNKSIWQEPISLDETKALTNKSIDKLCHSCISAVILDRISKTKKLIKSENNITNYEEDFFRYVIEPILLHNLPEVKPKLRLENGDDFFATYLMIIDELQNYGRSTDNKELYLDPRHISFEYNNGKINFEIDNNYKNYKSCNEKYNIKCVYDNLVNKIEQDSLDKVLNLSGSICLGCLFQLFN